MDSIKDKMVLVCKALQKQRLLDGYGHVTARLPDGRILSTPHMPPGKVAARDLIIIDSAGNKLEGAGEPNGETAMHTSIYKARPDVQSILQYHPDELSSSPLRARVSKSLPTAACTFIAATPIYDSPL